MESVDVSRGVPFLYIRVLQIMGKTRKSLYSCANKSVACQPCVDCFCVNELLCGNNIEIQLKLNFNRFCISAIHISPPSSHVI